MKSVRFIVVLGACSSLFVGLNSAHAQWSLNGMKVFYNAGNVGVGIGAPAYTLDVRSAGPRAINASANAASGATYGLYAQSKSTSGRGVYGYASATSGTNYGVYGKTNSASGFAGYFLGGKNYFQGNVGIGTSAPSAKLHVSAAAGTESVRLPAAAIDSREILDEPGVASDAFELPIALDGTYLQTLTSRDITVSATGYVLVIGSVQASVVHANGVESNAEFTISNAAGSPPGTQELAVTIPSNAPSDDYQQVITIHALFPVLSGLNTFYLYASEYGGDWSVNKAQFTLLFIPTAYGTVVSPDGTDATDGSGGEVRGAANNVAPASPSPLELLRAEKDAQIAQLGSDNNDLRERLAKLEELVQSLIGRSDSAPR